jgi:hypothetical protein
VNDTRLTAILTELLKTRDASDPAFLLEAQEHLIETGYPNLARL